MGMTYDGNGYHLAKRDIVALAKIKGGGGRGIGNKNRALLLKWL